MFLVSCSYSDYSNVEDVSSVTATTLKTRVEENTTTTSVSISTTTVIPTSSTQVFQSSTSTVSESYFPAISSEFCTELAFKSAESLSNLDPVLYTSESLTGPVLHALLTASRDLIIWAASLLPHDVIFKVEVLIDFYRNIGYGLDKLNLDTVTKAQVQGVLFANIFSSSSPTRDDLQKAVKHLTNYLKSSCGVGYPLFMGLNDLFVAFPITPSKNYGVE